MKAVVGLKPDTEATREEIIAFSRERLAKLTCPRSVDAVPTLPRNPDLAARVRPTMPVPSTATFTSDPHSVWGSPKSTIHGMPKRSVSRPNSSPHICFSSGITTVPPSESFWK